VAALPVAWQVNEHHAANEEVRRMQTQLLTAQNQGATVQADIERLRTLSARLEQSVAQQNERAARAADSARAFNDWKMKTRALLTAADYRWPDDSSFVRIPKSALPDLSELSGAEPFSPPGTVLSYARELMGLSPSERQAVEETLHRHFADVNRKLAAGISEIHRPLSGGEVTNCVFDMPEFRPEEAKQQLDDMLADVRAVLGDERWPIVQVRLKKAPGGDTRSDNLESILDQSKQFLTLRVSTDDKGALIMGYGVQGAVATFGTLPLSTFLPEGDPNRTDGADKFGRGFLSDALRERALRWLQEQAVAQFNKREKL
jgi:hypothetical protein